MPPALVECINSLIIYSQVYPCLLFSSLCNLPFVVTRLSFAFLIIFVALLNLVQQNHCLCLHPVPQSCPSCPYSLSELSPSRLHLFSPFSSPSLSHLSTLIAATIYSVLWVNFHLHKDWYKPCELILSTHMTMIHQIKKDWHNSTWD